MAASSSTSQPDYQRQETKHRRHHHRHRHLNVQVPAVASTGCFPGCFRPSPTSTSAANGNGNGNAHGDRPVSPSLIRSPSGWIRARGHSFGSTRHARRRSGDFQYDARSYARNFDEGVDGGEGKGEAGLAEGDALKYRCFSSRLPASPPAPSTSETCADGNGIGKEAARDME